MYSICIVLALLISSSSVSAGTLGALTYEIADGQVTITDCDERARGELVIPSEIEGLPVTSIGFQAFRLCQVLDEITIPDGVNSIGKQAFNMCRRLKSITIPEGVTSIGDSAFRFCIRLTSITLPNSLTSIGEWAFANLTFGATTITIPASVTSIGGGAFKWCDNLTSITLPEVFHDRRIADRLGISNIYPRGFFLPTSIISTPELAIRLPLQLRLTGDQNAEVIIDATDSLNGPWTEWRTIVIGEDGSTEIDLEEGAEKRFYRVRE